LISGPNPSTQARLLAFNRTQSRAVIGLLTGYNSLTKGKKVKVTLVQALRLCTGRTAYRGSRGIALPFMTTEL